MLTSSGYFIDGYFLQTSWQDFSNSDESLFYDGKNQEIGHSTIISKQNKKNHTKGKCCNIIHVGSMTNRYI